MGAMDDIVKRWRTASERALEEGVRIVDINGRRYATSSSQPLGAYELTKTDQGWACACVANQDYGMPCKHLAALADALDLDLLNDLRIDWNAVEAAEPAHSSS
jgi:hypothetical protein